MLNSRNCLIAAAVASLSSMALAQTGPQLLLQPYRAGTQFDGFAAATYFFDSNTDFAGVGSGDDVSAQLARYSVAARGLLTAPAAAGEQETLLQKSKAQIGFSLNHLTVDTDDDVLPESFTDVQLGVGTGIAEFDGWVAGITVGGGWAGASEFGDSDAYFGAATLLLGRQLDKNTNLGIALDYNGNRTFMPDVPLPGIVWTRQIPERDLEVSLGFPFTYGRWKPTKGLILEANFTFPDFAGARVSYEFAEGIGFFGSFAQRTDAWHTHDFGNDIDRVFLQQTLAEVGVRLAVEDYFVLNLAGGYAFGQDFRYGFDTRDTEEILEVDDGPFVRIEGRFSF